MKKTVSLLLSLVLLLGCVGVSAFAAEEKSFYVVLGDSIAYGSGLRNPVAACYGKIVADTNGYEYSNHSVPGHTTKNLIDRLTLEQVVADVKKADIISISIGGNDFLMSNLTGLMFDALVKEDYRRFDKIGETFYENFCEIIDIINGYNEDAVIVAQTLYNPQSDNLRPAYQYGADKINEKILLYAQEHPGEILIADVGTLLGDDMENYAQDDVHPSAKGNELIARQVLTTLAEAGLGQSTEPVITTAGEDIEISAIFTFYTDAMGRFFGFLGRIYRALTSLCCF